TSRYSRPRICISKCNSRLVTGSWLRFMSLLWWHYRSTLSMVLKVLSKHWGGIIKSMPPSFGLLAFGYLASPFPLVLRQCHCISFLLTSDFALPRFDFRGATI